ncbi:cytidine deaminase [Zymomonas mobilis subsp. mobilis ZM4 = ATCC 31821]|uniref:Cytidine deaminase n=1 Tax=Zymomonas mobilis subsp. mobilis (strain ATCC 31821 / ZM4 / CP4) TaxID=264203 RepID=Q5NP72_ZYMMO|nr:cytidine deaminase [Zymomonas mobilis]AAV89488.1 cytidine deaminase [Zymomonas mobilis subsp. mobilis ZM4 = ATCC 31821]AVZ25789.1 cytidine deaminase [Zymomonas mobilis subsp. mobilis]AVZ27680.1 cytidine deaminase [Zymomonas mobilis subsp. mobilis]AVZ42126.1 cytidine deaminase [Zymomonas mobilis subsp. mobilis ZM4 = ATCC 31821]UBQ08595.1 cytidine deaminase [Zymomonas mobilis]
MSESIDAFEAGNITVKSLMDKARTAARQSYSPYSAFAVGAALLLKDGSVITGTNFENASYGLTLCAETVAVATANTAGHLAHIRAIAICGGKFDEDRFIGHDIIYPCGRCRQVLNEAAEIGHYDIMVYCGSAEGSEIEPHRLSTLLPHSFGPKNLTSPKND